MFGIDPFGTTAFGAPTFVPDTPHPPEAIDASKVPARQTVVFEGGKRVVEFEGGKRMVEFQ